MRLVDGAGLAALCDGEAVLEFGQSVALDGVECDLDGAERRVEVPVDDLDGGRVRRVGRVGAVGAWC